MKASSIPRKQKTQKKQGRVTVLKTGSSFLVNTRGTDYRLDIESIDASGIDRIDLLRCLMLNLRYNKVAYQEQVDELMIEAGQLLNLAHAKLQHVKDFLEHEIWMKKQQRKDNKR